MIYVHANEAGSVRALGSSIFVDTSCSIALLGGEYEEENTAA
jgi:hypothetical protein